MLLRVGVIMIIITAALAAGVAVTVSLRADNSTPETTPVEPLAAETKDQAQEKKPNLGEKLEIKDEPRKRKKPEKRPPAEERETETLPVAVEDWPQPSDREVAAASAPRYYSPQQDMEMTLTVEKMGVYDAPVINSNSREALDRGVVHLPQTPMPWEEREQKNVYLAAHRLGWPGTGSHMIFYNLDKLKKGDPVVLSDASGTPYEYRVSEVFVVQPGAEWVVDPVRGRDMVTLQTCTYPDLENRIIVRADRV